MALRIQKIRGGEDKLEVQVFTDTVELTGKDTLETRYVHENVLNFHL